MDSEKEFRHLKINLNGQESWRITKWGSNSVFFLFLTTAFFDSCCHNGSVVKLLKVYKGLSYTILFTCFTYTLTDIKRNLFIFGTVIE